MIRIADPLDPRIEPYRAVRDRDLAGRHGLFLAEGEVVLRVLLSRRSRYVPDSLLLASDRIGPLGSLLDAVPEACPIYVADKAALEAIVGFRLHRGVLAAVSRRPEPSAAQLLAAVPAGRAAVAILAGIANHDNVGGAFRNAAAFGAAAVLLDAASCDPLYRKAVRVSVGGSLAVPFARGGTVADLLAATEAAGFEPVALSPAGRGTLADLRWPERAALLVGSEGHGLPAPILAGCRTVRIPMAPGFDSLNVATATGIALNAWRAGSALNVRVRVRAEPHDGSSAPGLPPDSERRCRRSGTDSGVRRTA